MLSVAVNPRSAAEAVRVSQVQSSLTALDQEITTAEQCVESLLMRLENVMMHGEQGNTGNTDGPRPVKVPVADSIDASASRISVIVGRLADATRRLEN